MNFFRYWMNPRNVISSLWLCGRFISWTALIFSGSAFRPSPDNTCPTYENWFCRNLHLPLLNFRPHAFALSMTCFRRMSCSAWYFPTLLYRPWWLHFHQCLRPSETSLAEIFRLPRQCQMEHEGSDNVRMECWTCTVWSFLRQVSTGSNLKFHQVLKTPLLPACSVRLLQSSSWGNVLAWSLCSSLLGLCRFCFLGVSTMTMLFTRSVGSSCFLITPSFSILWSSSLTRSWSATGTFLGACTTGGTLGSSLILYSPGRQPNPLNESAYSSVISTPTEQSLSISHSLWHASTPRIAALSFSVTKELTLCSTFLQTHVRFVVPSVLMWCPEYDVSLALDFVIFLSLTRLSVLNTLCEMILHLAPVSSWKFTLTPSTSMVLYQPVFIALMSFWFIVPTKYSVSELSESSTVFTLCLCERLVTFFFVLHIFSKWFFALHFRQTLPIAGQGASPCCLPHLPHVCVAALDFESLCLQFFFFTACTPCSVSSVICLSCWTKTSSTLATSIALSRVKSEPVSMSFSRTLADFVPNTILSRTMSSSACPYSVFHQQF